MRSGSRSRTPARPLGSFKPLPSPRVRRSLLPAALLALVIAAAVPAAAQDEDAVERSRIFPLASKSLLLDSARVGDILAAVGERGHVLLSADNGATWEQRVVPTRSTLTGVFFHDETLGWAVGHDSVILRTADGGATWERVNWAPDDEAPLFDVWFADADTGFAVGAYGTFLVTADGGLSWDFAPIGEDDFHLHRIRAADDGTLFMAAEAGVAYRSDDDGETWEELPSPYDGSFFGVLPLEGESLILFGLRGHLYRSEDAGETWQQIETGTVAMLTDAARLTGGEIIVVGLGGTVLVSKDGGRTFTLSQHLNRRGIQAVTETADGKVLLVGEFGVAVKTVAELGAAAN